VTLPAASDGDSRTHPMPRTAARHSAWRTVAGHVAPPLAIFLLVRLLTVAAAFSSGHNPMKLGQWLKWDAELYVSIARDGLILHRTADPNPHSRFAWTGNAMCFPGYPLMVRPFLRLGLSAPLAAMLVTAAAQLLGLALMWELLGSGINDRPAAKTQGKLPAVPICLPVDRWMLLGITGFFPGAVYAQAPFPIAVVNLLLLIQLMLLVRKPASLTAMLCAGLAGALAAFSYHLAALAGVVLCVAAASRLYFDGTARRQALRPLLAGILTLSGTVAVFVYDYLAVGVWDSFFKVQRIAPHQLINPLESLWWQWAALFQSRALRAGSLPALLATVFVVLTITMAARRHFRGVWDRLVVSEVVTLWLVPLFITYVGFYRVYALLWLCPLVLIRVPRPAKFALLILCVYVNHELTRAYFRAEVV
jgi:hypothetical protein